MDLARSIQVITEEVMLKMAHYVQRETGMKNLCLAGGVALNCVANGRVLERSCRLKIFGFNRLPGTRVAHSESRSPSGIGILKNA